MPAERSGPTAVLEQLLERRLATTPMAWLRAEAAAIADRAPARRLFMAFSAVPRHVPRTALELDADEVASARAARPGWTPSAWTLDAAGRTWLLLHAADDDPSAFVARVDDLAATADLHEAVALYGALPVLPGPELFVARCADGLRTNMTDVFRAIAHHNPYPADHLPEAAWNQMVLKALFVDVPLAPITGLDARANPALARMLCEYAHERRAAGRTISPELWRCVGPHADDAAVDDLARALAGEDAGEREAARAALRASPHPRAGEVLAAAGVAGEENA